MAIINPIGVTRTDDPKELRKWQQMVADRLSFQTYAGDPTNNILARWQGDVCFDTSNSAWYKSTGTAAASWKKLTP